MTLVICFDDKLAEQIFTNNQRAGWWTNPHTGESIHETRDRLNVLALITSELSEASYGEAHNLMDDKLPHLPMFDVELADAQIRIYDLVGAEIALGRSAFKNVSLHTTDDHKLEQLIAPNQPETADEWLMQIVNQISHSLEGYRKNNFERAAEGLFNASFLIEYISDLFSVNLEGAIREKLHFNAHRPDHKLENRLKDDGKKF